MNADIVTLEERKVLGSVARINPMDADYVSIWREGFDPFVAEVTAMAAEPGYYGVYYGCEVEEKVDFLAGMVVKSDAAAPDGLTVRSLPGGLYARFDSTMGTIGATWDAIYRRWLPASGYAEDESRPAMEYFAPDMGEGPDAPVVIYAAVAEKRS